MTQETPAKILSLLGVAVTSMFFLFAVSVSNANFSQTERPLPQIVDSNQVVAMLDSAANGYDKFVQKNLVDPGVASYAMAQDNINYRIDNADTSILAYTGLSSLAEISPSQSTQARAQVAGAYTEVVISKYYPEQSGANMFSFLLGK